jgi:hypothetical protein
MIAGEEKKKGKKRQNKKYMPGTSVGLQEFDYWVFQKKKKKKRRAL